MKKYLVLVPFVALSLIVSCQSNASKSTTIYAADDHKIEIIFDAGAGVYDDGLHARSMKLMPGYTWKDIKGSAPSAADIDCGDSIFKGWNTSKGPITDAYPFDKDTVLYADYTIITRIAVTVDPNGGYWEETAIDTPKSFVAIEGETWGKYYDSYAVEASDPTTNEFKYWTVNEDSTPIDNTYVLKEGDVIKANYGVKGTTNDFETDSWPVFINALNKGFDFIKNNDHEAGGYSNDFAGTFVGLERTIRIYNKDYTVKVIGENVDPITGQSGKYATLTFQFVDAIENAVGWNNKDDNDYKNNSLRSYLNDQFIDALPDDIINNIVSVDKYTYAGGGTGKPIISTSEKIFLPSLVELNISEFKAGEGITVTSKNEGLGADHTSCYVYYNGTEEGDALKRQYNGTDCNYWLRSPDAEGSGQAWYVDNNGHIGSNEGSYPVQYGLGITPCFTLGKYLGE